MKKRILFTVDTISKSGIVNVVNNIASQLLLNDEYEVGILCTGIEERDRVSDSLTVYNLDVSKYGRRKKYFKLIPAIKKFFNNNHFDYVVVSGMEFVPFYYIACKNLNIKLIAWEHRNFNSSPTFRLEWIGKRIACKSFDKIVCITKKDEQSYIDYCLDRKKICQIYNTPFQTYSKGYHNDSKKIITVGYLDEHYKGYDILVEVADIVLHNHSDWTWHIYGQGKDELKIHSNITKHGLDDKLILKGFIDNIKDVYNEYSFFVFTSRTEGMGMVLVEAQLNDLPIVSFDIECGPSDVIEDNVNGYLIKPFDVKQMAEKIEYLISNEEVRQKFSKNSRLHLDEFEKEYVLNKWLDLFKNI